MVEHTIEDNRIDWEGNTVISNVKNWFKRRVKEAILNLKCWMLIVE